MPTELKRMLEDLAVRGGCIVSTADCSELEITNAKQRGDLWVDGDGQGYIHRLPSWLKAHDPYCRSSVVTQLVPR